MNGWKNVATWEAYTTLANTEWMYTAAAKLTKESAKVGSDKHEAYLANLLREQFGAQSGVCWDEIAEALIDSAKVNIAKS